MKALDIVLLPDDPLRRRAIEISALLDEEMRLGEADYLPHLTLAMAASEDEEGIIEGLRDLARRHAPIHWKGLSLTQPKVGPSRWLVGESSPELRALHDEAVGLMRDAASEPAQAEHFFGDAAGIGQGALRWVDDYASRHSGPAFSPHLTLGYGSFPDGTEIGIECATLQRLALVWLGRHCSARRVLGEVALSG